MNSIKYKSSRDHAPKRMRERKIYVKKENCEKGKENKTLFGHVIKKQFFLFKNRKLFLKIHNTV